MIQTLRVLLFLCLFLVADGVEHREEAGSTATPHIKCITFSTSECFHCRLGGEETNKQLLGTKS